MLFTSDAMTSEDRLIAGARAVVSLTVTAAATALALGLRIRAFETTYFWHNEIAEPARIGIVDGMLGAAALAGGLASAWLFTRGRTPEGGEALRTFATRAAPIAPLGGFTCFFHAPLWNGHPLVFLTLVATCSLVLGVTVSSAFDAEPGTGGLERLRRLVASWPVRRWLERPSVPLAVVLALTFGYVVWFSYYTVAWHRAVRSGYDLAIEDSILWNLLHGRFFHAAPTLGPTGSHFGRHATLISYFILPFYALHQNAETLLVVQSVLLGVAAVPLFFFARRRIGGAAAVLVASLYLFHPAVQESNLFEVHYVKFGTVFFWFALWFLDAGRTGWALVAAALTLLVREDVATWVVLLGLFAFFSGRAVKVGLLMAAGAAAYVVVVKFLVMPGFRGGNDDLLFMYQELLPKGRSSFGWVLVSVLGNPGYTLETLLDPNKLLFFLQVLVPMALLPLRRAVGWFALMPGILYCFLGTHYPPLVDIHYQYSPHLLAFLFPSLVLVLEEMPPLRTAGGSLSRLGAAAALAAATLACTYQFGAVLQQKTSRGGPIPYKFGPDREGDGRRRSIDALLAVIPADARVACSAFAVPQLSARHNAYSLSLGLYDADWIVAPTTPSEYVGQELERTREELTSGRFGVVAAEGPFFAARKGVTSELTAETLRRLGSGARR